MSEWRCEYCKKKLDPEKEDVDWCTVPIYWVYPELEDTEEGEDVVVPVCENCISKVQCDGDCESCDCWYLCNKYEEEEE